MNVYKAMQELGFQPRFTVTSMWATKQESFAYHHLHTHRNSFLGSVMYIHTDSPTSGTTFVNPTASMWQLEPAYHGGSMPLIANSFTTDFEEGSAHVFPGWLQHYTEPSKSSCRIVIAMNIMPVGGTNRDHYDRYEFPSDMNLLEIEKNVFHPS
jgi:hypothetical protein